MYIPEFWCGVGATIIFEIIAIVMACIFTSGGKRK